MTFTISISQARSMFTSLTSSWRYRNQVILGALIMSSVFCSSLVSKYFTTYNSDTCWSVVAELGTFWRSFVLFGNEKLNISTDQEEKSSQVKGSVSCGRIDCSSIWAKKCRKVFSIVTSYWKLFPFTWRLESIIFFCWWAFQGLRVVVMRYTHILVDQIFLDFPPMIWLIWRIFSTVAYLFQLTNVYIPYV